MPFALPYTALITPEAVHEACSGGVSVQLPRDAAKIGRLIVAATSEIERRLGRTLVVRAVTLAPVWQFDKVRRTYRAWLPQWPAVGAVDDVAFDGQAAYSDAYPDTLAYFAGYRREDQDLDALVEEVPDLDALPELLPVDIVDFCIDYVLYRHAQRTTGIGLTETEIDTGTAVVRRKGVRVGWFEENWPRIAHHRNPVL